MRHRAEQLSRQEDTQDDYHAYNPDLPSKADSKPLRSPDLPTTRERVAYVASLTVGILLTRMAQNDNMEEVL